MPQQPIVISGSPRRRGAVLLLMAVCIVILLGMIAFAVDVAFMQLTRTKLRAATDAAARAAGETLSQTHDLDATRQVAKDVALENTVASQPLILEDSDIQIGRIELSATGDWQFSPEESPINGIQVVGRRTSDSPSGTVPLFFGRLLGKSTFEARLASIVVHLDRDVCLVLDRSSSMKLSLTNPAETMGTSDPRFCEVPDPDDSRWAALVVAVDAFINALETTPQEEHLGLVTYASDYTNCGYVNNASDINQYLSDEFSDARAAMNSISNSKFNGATNIAAGIDAGAVVLTHPGTSRAFAGKTMVVFTDGHRTEGRQPELAAADAAALGITIHTVTLGNGANQPAMQAVAVAGEGNHYHAPDEASLVEIFRKIAFSMPVIMAK